MSRYFIWLTLIITLVISPFFGAISLSLESVLDSSHLNNMIFFDLRVPRVAFTFFAGAILGISGLLYQTLFRNALMTPYTLGISSGAVLGAGIAIRFGLGVTIFGISSITIFGFMGAVLTVFLLIYLSKFIKNTQTESLLLLGIALSLFYSSALMIIFYLGSSIQNDMLIRFTMGSLSIIGWRDPITVGIVAIFVTTVIYIYRFELSLLSISSESAKLKGVDTQRVTLILLVVSSLGIGTVVSISGPIGFVGLVVPHIVAKLHPSTINKRVIPTAIFGGLFLVVCDTITRAIDTQSELPIGIVTAIIGVPFFIYLIIRASQR